MKKRTQKQFTSQLQNPMMTMMMTMIMMMGTNWAPMAESANVLVGQVPDEIAQYILSQQAADFGGGIWTIREWTDYLLSFSNQEWAAYMSELNPEWQAEQWEEWWQSPEQQSVPALDWVLAFLNERHLLRLFRTAVRVAGQARQREQRRQRFSPY